MRWPSQLSLLIMGGWAGDKKANALLLKMAEDCLNKNQEMPAELRLYVASTLGFQARDKKRGRKKRADDYEPNLMRDLRVAATCEAVLSVCRENGLTIKPTRKPESRKKKRPESICSIAAEDLAKQGINISEDYAWKIWQRILKKYPQGRSETN